MKDVNHKMPTVNSAPWFVEIGPDHIANAIVQLINFGLKEAIYSARHYCTMGLVNFFHAWAEYLLYCIKMSNCLQITPLYSSADSIAGIEMISEDLNRNEEFRATGFMGKNSVLAWLRNLEPDSGHQIIPDPSMETAGRTQLGQRVSLLGLDSDMAVSYFLDDQKLPEPNTMDSYKLPSKNIARWILHSYFKSVHPLFPIVGIDLFLEQYESLWRVNGCRKPGQKWQAIFNIILAIGCRRLEVMQQKLPPGVSHEVFFSRARVLSVNDNITFEHPDLQQVQIEALMALYFMISMQINR